jgi:hypothetical protein
MSNAERIANPKPGLAYLFDEKSIKFLVTNRLAKDRTTDLLFDSIILLLKGVFCVCETQLRTIPMERGRTRYSN